MSLNHTEVLAHVALTSELLEQIIQGQKEDPEEIPHIRKLMVEGRGPHFSIDEQGVVRYKDRLVVLSNEKLKRKILNEAHHSKLSIHPGSNKMYHDLRQLYWWSYMKQDITQFVAECDTCGRIKADHMRTPGYLQPLPIPVWKWEDISMDFMMGLPVHPRAMILFGSLWTVSLSLLILSRWTLNIQPRSMLRYILIGL